ncbi:streptophobe family protein [Streptomyces pactum]|uniref:streptophobe family protein n=1 Tax=Streptomyces pactum TaxID=68249 RepID=UPI0036F6FA02
MAANHGGRGRTGEVLLSALAAVGWAFLAMVGVGALGLHLMEADRAGSLGPMTAAAVVLAVGGSVEPSGDVRVFGLEGADATSAIDVMPLGVSLTGALLLGGVFLRALRRAGPVPTPAGLAVRAGAVAVLFLLVLAGLCWVADDTVTIDGSTLGRAAGEGAGRLPADLGDLADIGGGLLPDRLVDLAGAEAEVGITVATARTLLGGAVWVAGVLLLALLVSRRTPLPRGWEAVHPVVRPAASALCTVLLLATGAATAAGVYASIGDEHPRLVLGGTLIGAPNGAGTGVPLGLFVPWHGTATGALRQVLPDPLDELLGTGTEERITVGRLAEQDGRVWLLVVGCVLMMLAAGVLTAARTPVPAGTGPGGRDRGPYGFAGWCALRLGVATALALPLLVRLTGVSATAGLSVFGFDAFAAGLDLHGSVPWAVLLGAAWGAAAGFAGALAAWYTGAAGVVAGGPGRPGGPAPPGGRAGGSGPESRSRGAREGRPG